MNPKLVSVVAVGVALISSAAAAYLYLRPHVDAGLSVTGSVSKPKPTSPEADMQQRFAVARRSELAIQDKFLTGDPTGHAEWVAPTEGFYTTCGVTPDGRYLLANNEIGKSRYDEPFHGDGGAFAVAWSRANCETTSPIHQLALLRRVQRAREAKADEDFYNETHPENTECLIAEMRADYSSPEYHLRTNKHYCQDGSYERDHK